MVFNSLTFCVFFALVVFLHYLPLPWWMKKFNLLIASYLFYAAWNPPFVALLWISTLVDWYAVKLLAAAESRWLKRLAVLASLLTNLGLLAFFKYGNFLLENFITLAGTMGVAYEPLKLDIILPVGISFYTFQTLSYTLDVARGKAKPWKSMLDFALYVTFFPQLVAGPIVRAVDFLPQCLTPRRATLGQFCWGLNLLLVGLFEKIVLADGFLAPVVEQVYDGSRSGDFISAWVGTFAFAGQIFCDFAGYSTCAIGAALCLGFALPDNFKFPYAAVGFSDFWRRWHISLSTWLRDYLYIQLGGNRKGVVRTYVNLMLTMLIGGLWHGASWTFVIWGGLHGLYLVAERLVAATPLARMKVWQTQLGKISLALFTFLLVCLTWVFFRAKTFDKAFDLVGAMVGTASESGRIVGWDALMSVGLIVGGLLALQWWVRDSSLEATVEKLPPLVWSCINAVMIVAIFMMPGEDRAFIYFQF